MSFECRRWTLDKTGQTVRHACPSPSLIPGHILLQIHAITLLPPDCSKLGYSFAGTVLSSYDTSRHDIGAKVWGFHATTTPHDLASVLLVPEWSVCRMKTNLTFAECSTLGGPAMLATQALQAARLPATGKPRVLVHGGHTAIATFVMQAARVMKCEVECTVPLEHRDACRELGTTDFVDLMEGTPAGMTLAGFRGRRERNFHLVVDCLGDDVTLYDHIERYTHEGAKYVTIKEQSVSWSGFFKRMTTSVPRDYLYLSHQLAQDNAERKMVVVHHMLSHPEFVRIAIQDEYGVEDLAPAIRAAETNLGFGCTVVEVTAPDGQESEGNLEVAMKQGQVSVATHALDQDGARKKGVFSLE